MSKRIQVHFWGALCLALVALSCFQPGQHAYAAGVTIVPEKDDGNVCATAAPESGSFRILQVTDLHYAFYEEEGKIRPELRCAETNLMMEILIAQTKPDLLMVTGDVWPENEDELGVHYMRYAISRFEKLGVPWAFVWGNHDRVSDYPAAHKELAAARNSLYRGAAGDGNYTIDIVRPNGTRAWQLVCLNSKMDSMGQEQQAWMKTLVARDKAPVPRMAFFHVPLKQYEGIWTSGVATGFRSEQACTASEDGSTLPVFRAIGVKATFCGHDHINDYSGVVDGVELVYGRCTGSIAYGTPHLPKGGKLITLNLRKGTYAWASVTPDGKKWHPKRGERIEKPKPDPEQ